MKNRLDVLHNKVIKPVVGISTVLSLTILGIFLLAQLIDTYEALRDNSWIGYLYLISLFYWEIRILMWSLRNIVKRRS